MRRFDSILSLVFVVVTLLSVNMNCIVALIQADDNNKNKVAPVKIKWSREFLAYLKTSPVLSMDGETLFIASGDAQLHALHAHNGSHVWSFTAGDSIYSTPTISSDGTMLFFGANDAAFYAISTSSGRLSWKNNEGFWSPITLSTPVEYNGKVYFTDQQGMMMYVLSAAKGKTLWQAQAYSPPFISPSLQTVFVGWQSGGILGYSIDDGSNTFQFTPESADTPFCRPFATNATGKLFASSQFSVFAVDAHSGKQDWVWNFSRSASSTFSTCSFIIPVTGQEFFLVSDSNSGQLVALAEFIAMKVWSFQPSTTTNSSFGPFLSPAEVVNGVTTIADNSGNIFVVNATTGQLVAQGEEIIPSGQIVKDQQPLLDSFRPGVGYFVGSKGGVYAVEWSTGIGNGREGMLKKW